MGLFGRKKQNEEAAPKLIAEVAEEPTAHDVESLMAEEDIYEEPTAPSDPDPAKRAELGPWDVTETAPDEARIDLGALRIPGREGMALRIEVEPDTDKVVAVNLGLGENNVQLQAFAAPRSEGIWDDIRTELMTQVEKAGGSVDEVPGHFGREVLARVPAMTPEGRTGHRVARFVGIDGPRWFVRAVFSGPAAHDEAAAVELEEVVRGTVVVRGKEPRAPRDLLELRLPFADEPSPAGPAADGGNEMGPLERGPEIQQIG